MQDNLVYYSKVFILINLNLESYLTVEIKWPELYLNIQLVTRSKNSS